MEPKTMAGVDAKIHDQKRRYWDALKASIELAIFATPTSPERDKLTEWNIEITTIIDGWKGTAKATETSKPKNGDTATIKDIGPTRFLCDPTGGAISYLRWLQMIGPSMSEKMPVAIWVRNDGWSLAVPDSLRVEGYSLWKEDWVGVWVIRNMVHATTYYEYLESVKGELILSSTLTPTKRNMED